MVKARERSTRSPLTVTLDHYVIRAAEPADIHLLPSIERRAVRLFEEWLATTGLTREVLENVSTLAELEEAQRQGHLWVALSGDHVVGFAQVVILDGCAHLDEVDVVPEHGRKGLGSRFVSAVCQWARDAGYPKVTLSTFRAVPWNQAFYEKRGFRVVDAHDLGPDHVALVASERDRGLRTDLRVVMQRALTADTTLGR